MNSQDELKAENLLLKLKLEMEHGMMMCDTSKLDPEIENQWLSNIYNFERQSEDAKQTTVYDLIGRPDFKPLHELTAQEVSDELSRLLNILWENQINFSCICKYEDELIYRFITEEFFEHVVDEIRIDGMINHYIYEEFYPNHDYDLRRYTTEFIEKILNDNWVPEFDKSDLTSEVTFRGKQYDGDSISGIIQTFQEAFHPVEIKESSIEHVGFDLEEQFASVRMQLSYSTRPENGKTPVYTGKAFLNFKMEFDYWRICSFQLPGFGGE